MPVDENKLRASKRWALSVRNADYCIKNGKPKGCFLCAVPGYKDLIWNERLLYLRAFHNFKAAT